MASKGANLSRTLGRPSDAEKLVLGSLFPSSSGVKREAPQFDPLADVSQHKKKKPSNKLTVRPFTREVVLLPQHRGTVPRNKVRQELQHQKRMCICSLWQLFKFISCDFILVWRMVYFQVVFRTINSLVEWWY